MRENYGRKEGEDDDKEVEEVEVRQGQENTIQTPAGGIQRSTTYDQSLYEGDSTQDLKRWKKNLSETGATITLITSNSSSVQASS